MAAGQRHHGAFFGPERRVRMKTLRRGWKRLLGSLSRERSDMSEELQSHIEMQIDDKSARACRPRKPGVKRSSSSAGSKLPRKTIATSADCRGSKPPSPISAMPRGGCARAPSFTIVAVLTLALGIGANTAIFGLVNQVLLHPPGISHPERIVVLRTKYDKLKLNFEVGAPPAFAAMRDGKEVFEHAAAAQVRSYNYADQQVPERLLGSAVTAEWFNVFGARPALGRVFTQEEDQPNANRVAVLAYGAWLRLFGGDTKVIGRSIVLNQQPYQVIGVMSRDFRWPASVDLWVPLALAPDELGPKNWFNENLWIAARMQKGVPPTQADVFLKTLASRVLEQAPAEMKRDITDAGWGLLTMPFRDSSAGVAKMPVLILLGAVGMVLLIACSNIAGLMLARTSTRARELAVRAALGATRARLMRAGLAETVLLMAVGGAVGVAMAQATAGLLLRLAPENAVAGLDGRLDVYVLAFAVLATLVAGVLFGLVPAWQLSKVDPHDTLQSGGRTLAGGARQRLRSGLVVVEAAMALVLLVGAGLFLRSLARLEEISPGFEPHGVMTAAFALPTQAYADGKAQAVFIRSVLERLQMVNGVTAASVGTPIPFSGELEAGAFAIQGRTFAQGEPGPHAERRWVTPGYLNTFGIVLSEGRFFTDLDRMGTESVAVIDERLARRYWPNEDPLDKRIEPTSGEGVLRIVGVVKHVMQSDLASDADEGVLYESILQHPMPFGSIAVKGSGDVNALAGVIRDAVRETDAGLPLFNMKSMDAMVGDSLAPRRFLLRVLGFFAGVALFLAALGLYGVISYSVAQRTREIGIRMALGAERRSVLALVVGQGFRLAAIGVGLGVAGALLGGRMIQSQLFGVRA